MVIGSENVLSAVVFSAAARHGQFRLCQQGDDGVAHHSRLHR